MTERKYGIEMYLYIIDCIGKIDPRVAVFRPNWDSIGTNH